VGRGLELTAKGLAVSLFALGACSESSGEQTTPADAASAKAAAIIMGTVVNTENKQGVPVGVRGYVDPHDPNKVENGFYNQAARVPFICFEIGRLGVDTDVPGPDAVQWSVWYNVNGGYDGKSQWLPQPYVQTDAALPRC
jgi:hypothetical protein